MHCTVRLVWYVYWQFPVSNVVWSCVSLRATVTWWFDHVYHVHHVHHSGITSISSITSIAATVQGSHDYQRREWLHLKAYLDGNDYIWRLISRMGQEYALENMTVSSLYGGSITTFVRPLRTIHLTPLSYWSLLTLPWTMQHLARC